MRYNISKLFVFGLVMIMLASLSVVSAQQTTQDIEGQVRDNSYDTVDNAEVRFTSQNNGMEYYGNTDNDGEFEIHNIPDGNYDVNINAGGYDELHQTTYVDGGNTYFDFTLSSQNGGDDGDGGDGEDFDPFGQATEEFEDIIMYLIMAIVLFYTLLIIITIMTIAIFVRLGKIKRSTAELKDTVKDLNNKTMSSQPQYQQPVQQPAPEQYQQPPPEQPPEY